jgi:hypothetical protein
VWVVVAVYAISIAAWVCIFLRHLGQPIANGSVRIAERDEPPLSAALEAPGLLFDQEYGVLAYAPVYVSLGRGSTQMWRPPAASCVASALEITFIFSALLVMVGSFHIWWGGSAAPARPIAAGLPLLMLPLRGRVPISAAGSRAAARNTCCVGWRRLCGHAGAGQNGLSDQQLATARRRCSISGRRAGIWTLAPSFVRQLDAAGCYRLVAGIAGAAFVLSGRAARARSRRFPAFTIRVALLIIAYPPVAAVRPHRGAHDRSRRQGAAGGARRLRCARAARIDRLRPAAQGRRGRCVAAAGLGVKPLQRSDRQPVRVIHNGRFSLPAGTYDVAVQFQPATAVTAAAVAADRPQRSAAANLDAAAAGGQQWHTTLWLPVDANFVGLRGPDALERAIESITITPTAVVDAGRVRSCRSCSRPAIIPARPFIFHNEQLYPEAQGFWTMAARLADHRRDVRRPHRAGDLANASGRTPNTSSSARSGGSALRSRARTIGGRRAAAVRERRRAVDDHRRIRVLSYETSIRARPIAGSSAPGSRSIGTTPPP